MPCCWWPKACSQVVRQFSFLSLAHMPAALTLVVDFYDTDGRLRTARLRKCKSKISKTLRAASLPQSHHFGRRARKCKRKVSFASTLLHFDFRQEADTAYWSPREVGMRICAPHFSMPASRQYAAIHPAMPQYCRRHAEFSLRLMPLRMPRQESRRAASAYRCAKSLFGPRAGEMLAFSHCQHFAALAPFLNGARDDYASRLLAC